MGHNITAILLKGSYDKNIAEAYDLRGKALKFNLTLFPIDHNFSAYWQAQLHFTGCLETIPTDDILKIIYPNERVIYELMAKITDHSRVVEFAIIATDYFGGIGTQIGNAYRNDQLIPLKENSINAALKALGVRRKKQGILNQNHLDEFDTIELGDIRSNPDYLDKYADLTEELGL